jgi:hypothetical protein
VPNKALHLTSGAGNRTPLAGERRCSADSGGVHMLNWIRAAAGAAAMSLLALHSAGAPQANAPSTRPAEGDSKLVSRVGPVASYVSRYYAEGAVHPTYGCSIHTELAGEKSRSAKITELFEDEAVFRALVYAWPIMDALKGRWPPTLKELLKALEEPSCTADWASLQTAFAVMDLRDGDAVVRFNLGHGCEAGRGSTMEFDVLIGVPPERERWFREAKKAGLLGAADTCGGSHEWSCCLKWSR